MQNRADLISDVLRVVQLSGAIFFEVNARAPWISEAPRSNELLPLVMPEAQGLIEYHVMLQGEGWAEIVSETGACERVRLEAGSVIIFPHGDAHRMGSDLALESAPDLGHFAPPDPTITLPFKLEVGEGTGISEGTCAELICGFLGHSSKPFNPLLEALPRILHVRPRERRHDKPDDRLLELIQAAVEESHCQRIGSSAVLSRLCELIFIAAVRRYVEDLPENASGWLAAVRTPGVSKALALIHSHPARDWTLEQLAREAGMSRSVMAERFNAVVGTPPMTYLSRWRMQLAAKLMETGSLPLRAVAESVGYETEASFSRGFKRVVGMSPGQWRRRTRHRQ